jgi:hypothetical protein
MDAHYLFCMKNNTLPPFLSADERMMLKMCRVRDSLFVITECD